MAVINTYLNVNRLEFLVTRRCTGHCKHCSVIPKHGDPGGSYPNLDAVIAALNFLHDVFIIKSSMAFGGEPLLYPDATSALFQTATARSVSRRELITNGYFSKDPSVVETVVAQLLTAGVNDIKLSIDAFHQEYIPLQYVEPFIVALLSREFEHLTIHPAWLVSPDHANDYNARTWDLIQKIRHTYDLPISPGNIVTLCGLAKDHFSGYYPDRPIDLDTPCGAIPFTNSLTDIQTLRILPTGNVAICRAMVIGNLFENSIERIIRNYNPDTHYAISLMRRGGLRYLHHIAETKIGTIDLAGYRSPCDLCADCVKTINESYSDSD